ncbi:MAG: DUF1425 domain-containing protein [Phycisphaerae bacterium]|nr:DUF1425 domain-containing protein [Phycisphaerae bacterium]
MKAGYEIARTRRSAVLTLLLLAAFVPAACRKPIPTDPVGAAYDDVRAYPNITLSEPSLQPALGFQEPVVTRTPGGLLQVHVPVRARSGEELYLEHKVVWLDDRGVPVPPASSWVPLRLEPRQPTHVRAAATSDAAVNYNLQFRWGRP